MDDTILLQELEALARDLEVDLRYDEIEGRGGLCHYGGKAHLIISRDLALPERIHLLCRALSRFQLADRFIRPRLRELIEAEGPAAD